MNWYIAKGIRVTEKALLERYPSGIPPFVDEVILRADHDAALRRAKADGRQEGKEYALNEAAMRAGCAAHRACCGIEADNSQGKIHGYCVVCGVPWPCETAQFFLFKADARATQIEEVEHGQT